MNQNKLCTNNGAIVISGASGLVSSRIETRAVVSWRCQTCSEVSWRFVLDATIGSWKHQYLQRAAKTETLFSRDDYSLFEET